MTKLFTSVFKLHKGKLKVVDRVVYPNTPKGKKQALNLIEGEIENPSQNKIIKKSKTHKLIIEIVEVI